MFRARMRLSFPQSSDRILPNALRLFSLLLLGLQIALAGAGDASGQETANPMVHSIVQSVRDDVQRRIKNRESRTADLTIAKSDCPSCVKKPGRRKRHHRGH